MEEEAPTTARLVDQARADQELVTSIKKATSSEESAPKQKHVQSAFCFALLAGI
jgi:huntingtin-interacting protein 1-related protein